MEKRLPAHPEKWFEWLSAIAASPEQVRGDEILLVMGYLRHRGIPRRDEAERIEALYQQVTGDHGF